MVLRDRGLGWRVVGLFAHFCASVPMSISVFGAVVLS